MLTSLRNNIRSVLRLIFAIQNLPWKKKLPKYYLIGLVISFLLFGLTVIFPDFQICRPIGGQTVCAPVGTMMTLFLNIPGYFIGSILPNFIIESSWIVSFIAIVAISFVFYYFAGVFIDSYLLGTSRKRIKLVLVATLALLSAVAVYLSLKLA